MKKWRRKNFNTKFVCCSYFPRSSWQYHLCHDLWASLVSQMVKNPLTMQVTWLQSLGWEDPLEEGMANHSSILVKESHGQRSLGGYSPLGRKESDMT